LRSGSRAFDRIALAAAPWWRSLRGSLGDVRFIMRYMPGGTFVHAQDFARYCIDAFDALWREAEQHPAMISAGLHPRLIGRPGRIAGIERFLEHVRTTGRVWLARRMDLVHHWRALLGLPEWTSRRGRGRPRVSRTVQPTPFHEPRGTDAS
jgi:peptidoglycan/xylan/chitin deacetylase (PgdA/CDA1 family)